MPSEYFLSISGFEIHIDHYKPTSPKAQVILFHGIGGNGRLLSFIALPLMENGFEVICPDMPLYGCTHYHNSITYNDWVSCGSKIVLYYQNKNVLPTFLFGLSAGGMLSYQIACECENISGLICTCMLDLRNKWIIKNIARSPSLGSITPTFLSLSKRFIGNTKIPIKWITKMKSIANNKEFVSILLKDKKSSGAKVSLDFLYSMLNLSMKVEPENFDNCPILLVHPGDDRWTDIKLSNIFFNRLICEKEEVVLFGAGHFPIEEAGLKQLEIALIQFINKHL